MKIKSFEVTIANGTTYGFDMVNWEVKQDSKEIVFTHKKDANRIGFVIKNVTIKRSTK